MTAIVNERKRGKQLGNKERGYKRERETEGGFIGEDRERRRERLRGLHRGREREREKACNILQFVPRRPQCLGEDAAMFRGRTGEFSLRCKLESHSSVKNGRVISWISDFQTSKGIFSQCFLAFFRYSTSPP